MPWVKGQKSANPGGLSKQHRQLLAKVRNSLDMAIEGLGDKSKSGATAMAELITQALKDDVVGTLKAFAQFIPKEINIDVQDSGASRRLTDDELADIIASRSRERLLLAKAVDGEIIDQDMAVSEPIKIESKT